MLYTVNKSLYGYTVCRSIPVLNPCLRGRTQLYWNKTYIIYVTHDLTRWTWLKCYCRVRIGDMVPDSRVEMKLPLWRKKSMQTYFTLAKSPRGMLPRSPCTEMISILGLFDEEGSSLELEAAKMAIHDVNREPEVIPGYFLRMHMNTTKVSSV